jgi:hypothetical protein
MKRETLRENWEMIISELTASGDLVVQIVQNLTNITVVQGPKLQANIWI